MGTKLLQIGEIAKESDVSIQTLRYYERRNIIKPQGRSPSGYRLYEEETIKAVRFIKHAQELGFPLEEIKELLGLRSTTTNVKCQRVRKKAKDRLDDVQEKLRFLKKTEKVLKKIIKDCEAQADGPNCPIIESME